MKPVLTQRALEVLLDSGGDLDAIPDDAVLTPSARDLVRDYRRKQSRERKVRSKGVASAVSEPAVPDYEYRWDPGSDPSSPQELDRFFRSPEIEELKKKILSDNPARLYKL